MAWESKPWEKARSSSFRVPQWVWSIQHPSWNKLFCTVQLLWARSTSLQRVLRAREKRTDDEDDGDYDDVSLFGTPESHHATSPRLESSVWISAPVQTAAGADALPAFTI